MLAREPGSNFQDDIKLQVCTQKGRTQINYLLGLKWASFWGAHGGLAAHVCLFLRGRGFNRSQCYRGYCWRCWCFSTSQGGVAEHPTWNSYILKRGFSSKQNGCVFRVRSASTGWIFPNIIWIWTPGLTSRSKGLDMLSSPNPLLLWTWVTAWMFMFWVFVYVIWTEFCPSKIHMLKPNP